MSAYRPYPKTKPSGVEWLGEVPEGWKISRIGRLAFTGMGQTILREMLEEDPSADALPVYSASEAEAEFGYFMNPSVRLSSGDLVVGARGSIGLTRRISAPSTCTQTTIWVKPIRSQIESAYLYWCMTGGREQLFPFDKTAIPMLTVEQVRSGGIPIPPFPEQIQIAAFLDRECGKLDALQAKQERLIELLKEKRQALISHAVTRGLDPTAKLKPSGIEWLGDVPVHWEVTRLKFVANIQTGIAKGKDNADRTTATVPYLRVANVQDGYLALDDIATIEIPVEELPRYSLRPGDVLMNEGGDFDKLGRGHVWRGEIEPCIHQNHVFAIRPILVSCEWLSAITSSNYARFYFMSRSKQSTNLASLSSTNLMELPVLRPPHDEQRAIVAHLDEKCGKIDQLKAKAERGIEALKERRSALISAAVTGKIDVRGAVD